MQLGILTQLTQYNSLDFVILIALLIHLYLYKILEQSTLIFWRVRLSIEARSIFDLLK